MNDADRSRRGVLRACGAVAASALAGCSSADRAPDVNATGTEAPESATGTDEAETATGTGTCTGAVHVVASTADTKADLSAAVGGTVEVRATAADGRELAAVSGVPAGTVVEQLEGAGFRVLSVSTVEWCADPVCDARAFVRFGSDAAVESVADDFPDAVAVLAAEGADGDPYRLVYSRAESTETLSERLDDGGYDAATAVALGLQGCTAGG